MSSEYDWTNLRKRHEDFVAAAERFECTKERSAKALAKREDALSASPTEAAAMTMRKRADRHVERMASISERGVDHIETMDGPEILNAVDKVEKLDKITRRTYGLKDDNPYQGFSLNVLSLGALGIELRPRQAKVIEGPTDGEARGA